MKDSDPLERVFLHQSPTTGQVSAAKLTLRQLCRLLCPANAEASNNVTAPVQVLEVLPDGTYSPSGWEPTHNLPILREALSQWYYEDDAGETKGPLTCRQVAEQISSSSSASSNHESTRFYSTLTGSWKALTEIPDLQAALKAFETPKPDSAAAAPVEYDPTAMAFPVVPEDDESNNQPAVGSHVQEELEAFLASTDKLGNQGSAVDEDADADDEAYESDGGTRYVRDWRTGNFVHEDLVAPRPATSNNNNNSKTAPNESQNNKRSTNNNAPAGGAPSKKRKKPKFAAKNAKNWVYMTGLPPDATEDEVATFFSKVGILDLDPETQRPKVKVYRHKEGAQAGQGKGDGSVCYARPESVELALSVLDEAPFRPEKDLKALVRVQRAKFEQRGDLIDGGRQQVSIAKRKVAQLAVKQAMDWDGGEYNGRLTGGMKGLRIIVLQPMFERGVTDEVLESLEKEIHSDCETCGAVEKITVFASNPRGVVIVKFTQPTAASEAVKLWDGREFDGRKVKATFWDGVTDYTVRNEAKEEADMEKRHEEFGEWLESQDLPEEFRLQVDS